MRRSSGRSRRTVFGFAAALLALGLVAAACGSDDSSSGSGTTAGGGAGTTASGGAGTTAASTAEPVAGGKLVVGIEADTGSPWTPSKILCAVSCYQTLSSVLDPLVDRQRGRPSGPVSRRVDRAERRLHGMDDQGAFGRHVSRRHALRRRRHRGQPDPADEVVPHRQGGVRHRDQSGRQPADRGDRSDDRDDHDEAIMGGLPDLPGRTARLHRQPDVAQGRRRRPDARAEAGRHRSVHLQGLQAGRVVHRDQEPGLLEQALPVHRRVRDPRHPRRADACLRARSR